VNSPKESVYPDVLANIMPFLFISTASQALYTGLGFKTLNSIARSLPLGSKLMLSTHIVEGVGVDVGTGVGVGDTVGTGVGTGEGVGDGTGVDVGVSVGVITGVGVGVGVGSGDVVGIGVAMGVEVGDGVEIFSL